MYIIWVTKAPLSALALLGSLVIIILAGAVLPPVQGELFGGEAAASLHTSFPGEIRASFVDIGWGWQIWTLLPLGGEIDVSEASTFIPGDILSLLLPLVGMLALVSISGALLWGWIFKSRALAWGTLLSVVLLLGISGLSSFAMYKLSGPSGLDRQSEALLEIQKDISRPIPPLQSISIPGEELINPFSPYYGGEIICKDNNCRPVRYRP